MAAKFGYPSSSSSSSSDSESSRSFGSNTNSASSPESACSSSSSYSCSYWAGSSICCWLTYLLKTWSWTKHCYIGIVVVDVWVDPMLESLNKFLFDCILNICRDEGLLFSDFVSALGFLLDGDDFFAVDTQYRSTIHRASFDEFEWASGGAWSTVICFCVSWTCSNTWVAGRFVQEPEKNF